MEREPTFDELLRGALTDEEQRQAVEHDSEPHGTAVIRSLDELEAAMRRQNGGRPRG